jgi:hypothetical protein
MDEKELIVQMPDGPSVVPLLAELIPLMQLVYTPKG